MQSATLIDDSIYLGLLGIESVFNGKTQIGGVAPNLQGLSKSVSLKLKSQKQ